MGTYFQKSLEMSGFLLETISLSVIAALPENKVFGAQL